MATLRVILGDQLSETLPTLKDLKKNEDIVLFCEVMEEATYVHHHKKKIAFIFAAMRHFAEDLARKKVTVCYVKIDDPENTQNFDGEVGRAIRAHRPSRLVVTEPGEYRVKKKIERWPELFGLPVEPREDSRFLATHADFGSWVENKKQLRMEYFYRDMRLKHNILIESDGKPTGGQWNFDKENRKPPDLGMDMPKRPTHKRDQVTQRVLDFVGKTFPGHFGSLEPFHFAVSRQEAQKDATYFMDQVLPHFGSYQDAMVAGEPFLYHSIISMYLNIGLLLPLDVCMSAEKAYRDGKAPLHSVEGFIRQILGWREYMRGIYWHHMPAYGALNGLNAAKPLPAFYWTADTGMFCVAEAVRHTRDHAYSHHIQRLMITGNFALLAGLDVRAVQDWYLAVYADAYEWVEMPNTLGMALFGDGGIVASKPYAASGKYIHRMSNYCGSCQYDPNLTVGERACPFNALYWDFIARHQEQFRRNQRMTYVLATWNKFAADKQVAIRHQAALIMKKIAEAEL